jgi:hypothetical protein
MTLALGGSTIWLLPLSAIARVALALALLSVQLAIWLSFRRSLLAPVQALTNVVAAYRGGDYALRSRLGFSSEALGHLAHEINGLGQTLYAQRLQAMEASALLDKLVGSIDVAILAFSAEREVRVINAAAAGLLRLPAAAALGRNAGELALDELLDEAVPTKVVTLLAGQRGRWQVTHGTFRQGGLTQHLLIITDVMQALREEERAAWRRLIRVISHEVNNSLAPIKSLAGTLRDLLSASQQADALFGLEVIERRADSLKRFLGEYSRLARLPALRRQWVRVAPLVARVIELERAGAVTVELPEERCRGAAGGAGWTQTLGERQLARPHREGDRRRHGHRESRQPVRALFHDQGGRQRYRLAVVQADRRSTWRNAAAGKQQRRPGGHGNFGSSRQRAARFPNHTRESCSRNLAGFRRPAASTRALTRELLPVADDFGSRRSERACCITSLTAVRTAPSVSDETSWIGSNSATALPNVRTRKSGEPSTSVTTSSPRLRRGLRLAIPAPIKLWYTSMAGGRGDIFSSERAR